MPKAWLLLALSAASLYLMSRPVSARTQQTASVEAVEYLSEHPELIVAAQQGWGEMGLNVAAHQPGVAGEPLQIGQKQYAKGLGHHADGAIVVFLDGDYTAFEAELGLQPCNGGSVVFRILVDGVQRFNTGILRETNAPVPVRVDLAGASELRLEANDAGDGINCDMANWAEARLTRSGASSGPQSEIPVDVAPFARVVTWDPNRGDGARANRIEEFRPEDIFLETDLACWRSGQYAVPVTNGVGCIGLQWLNRKALKQLDLVFAQVAQVPKLDSVQIQAWFGESAWQGGWKALAGKLEADGKRLTLRLATHSGPVQSQKVRWIFPAQAGTSVARPSAFTQSRWQTVQLLVQADKPAKSTRTYIGVINGEFLPGGKGLRETEHTGSARALASEDRHKLLWNVSGPIHLRVRSSRGSSLKSDPTVLQFQLPAGSFGVAVDDVLRNGCVYLKEAGLFVSKEPAAEDLAAYRGRIAGQRTILEQVREWPDQTLQQALVRTHHDAQREGPVMLSLACDNTKYVIERNGTLQFRAVSTEDNDWFRNAGEMRPQFGEGMAKIWSRRLDGGWLPIPVISAENNGVLYSQRTFVAPYDEPGTNPARLNRASVCVAEFSLTNTQAAPTPALLALKFLSVSGQQEPGVRLISPGLLQVGQAGLTALLEADRSTALELSVTNGRVKFGGTLPVGARAQLAIYLVRGESEAMKVAGKADHLRREVANYWRTVLAPAAGIETPDPLLNDLIRSSQVRCLIAARNEANGERIAPWIAAMSYGPLESEAHSVIRGMDFLGHEEFARRGLEFFVHRYNTNGFLTTGYTTFGTAWHLWSLGEHYQLYHDTNWLRGIGPDITRVGDWIVRQTEMTKRSACGLPENGLMPPGVLADWNAFAYHFAMNGYYYAGLRELGAALADLNEETPRRVGTGARRANPSAQTFIARASELRDNILRAYKWTQAQSPALALRNGTWIPHYPSQVHSPGKLADFFPGQDAGRSWCYDVELGAHQLVPTGVLAPRDPEVERIMAHMEDKQFLADGWFDYPATGNEQDWFNLGGFSKVQPYYTRNCEIYALRDEVKPFVRSYFNTLAAMLNPEVLTFWEHFHHSGAWDKTHETGYFLHQTRTMLVSERGQELWLAPLVTSNWFNQGMTIVVSNAPTRFGAVSYSIHSRVAVGSIEVEIRPPHRQPPASIVVRLRHPGGVPIRSVLVNDRRWSRFEPAKGIVRLSPNTDFISVKAGYR